MKLSLQPSNLRDYIVSLLSTYFPDGLSTHLEIDTVNYALERLEFSHSHINKKYYQLDQSPVFNHLNADHLLHFCGFLGIQSSSILMMNFCRPNCLTLTRLCMV